ncbi:hypothetical protein TPDSL_17710 [Terrisporobacter petrolearius]|uniref:AraC family transcriptional regulator n=1 Tax=Terrisporobacter petrolearius TaxID=1460447 RepID=UPI00336953E5
MSDVNKVFITKEVADKLDLNSAYLIRLAKSLIEDGQLDVTDVRAAGKRNYIFNEKAIQVIKSNLKRKQK